MGFNIVLIEPEIPMNTGNIGRLSLGSGSTLHLVKPFGFELDDTRLKRAGLDYWQHLSVKIYESIDDFFAKNQDKHFAFLSSHGTQEYTDIDFQDDMFLIFGKESVGLPKWLIDEQEEHVFRIPLYSSHVRSLNLANAVGIVVYEGIRNAKKAARQKK
jgi:tRNA (cytidine/uridine-2'-O-)-methyltransferase